MNAVRSVYISLTRKRAGSDAQSRWAKPAACRTIEAEAVVHKSAESCCTPAPHVHGPSAGLRMQGPYRTDARAAGTSDSSPVTQNLRGCRWSQLLNILPVTEMYARLQCLLTKCGLDITKTPSLAQGKHLKFIFKRYILSFLLSSF
jgi:hypothetical protein